MLKYLGEIGILYCWKDPEKAEGYFKEAAEVSLATVGPNSADYEGALQMLRAIYSRGPQRANIEWRLKAIEVGRQLMKQHTESLGIRNERATGAMWVLAENLIPEGKAKEADEWIGPAAVEFSKAPPETDDDWSSLRNVIKAIRLSPDKEKHLGILRAIFRAVPKTRQALTAEVEFYRAANDWPACRNAYRALVTAFPEAQGDWYNRATTAIEFGDVEDYRMCRSEMLKRFGNEEKDGGILERVLSMFYLVTDQWSPAELESIERVYASLDTVADNGPRSLRTLSRAALALADYRLGKVQSALEHLNKAPVFGWGIDCAQVLAVTALCHAALGNYEKAIEAVAASDKALRVHGPWVDQGDVSRRNYLAKEVTKLIENKSQEKLPTRASTH
ncbi:MAG: hypothetical protein HY735_36095 [Verrucomicrobia bacterium]|nr:hypothetical protein [Verrucomicrobiota bacterium]